MQVSWQIKLVPLGWIIKLFPILMDANWAKQKFEARQEISMLSKEQVWFLSSAALQCIKGYQVIQKLLANFRETQEKPQEIAVAILLCQAFWNKNVFEILCCFNLCHNYKYLYNIKMKIASTVLEKTIENGRYCISSSFVTMCHIFFTMDNVGFKRTLCQVKLLCMALEWQ